MRLKIFTAGTIAEAMDRVRSELGDDAIIMSIDTDDVGAQVTAALEGREPEPLPRASEEVDEEPSEPGEVEGEVRQALTYHGVPAALGERIVGAAAETGAETVLSALTGAFDALFGFAPLPGQAAAPPLILVGPPGAGKTVAVAKLATRARCAEHRPTVITTDTRRAGGIEQLEAFTRILGVDLIAAASSAELAAAVGECEGGPVYIDTAGANPYVEDDVALVREMIEASGAEPVLVLPAGGDAMEAVDTAAAFASAGARRLVATRLDAARRLGGLIASIDATRMSFAEVSISHRVADPLFPVDAVALARLILPHTPGTIPAIEVKEAVP